MEFLCFLIFHNLKNGVVVKMNSSIHKNKVSKVGAWLLSAGFLVYAVTFALGWFKLDCQELALTLAFLMNTFAVLSIITFCMFAAVKDSGVKVLALFAGATALFGNFIPTLVSLCKISDPSIIININAIVSVSVAAIISIFIFGKFNLLGKILSILFWIVAVAVITFIIFDMVGLDFMKDKWAQDVNVWLNVARFGLCSMIFAIVAAAQKD